MGYFIGEIKGNNYNMSKKSKNVSIRGIFLFNYKA